MPGLLDRLGGLSDDPTMALAMGLLSAGGPQSRPVSIGQGLAMGMQGMQEAKQNQRRNMFGEMQMAEILRKQQAEQAQAEQLNQFAASLPPEQQNAFRIDPKGFIEAQRKAQEGYTLPPGARCYGANNQVVAEAPERPEAKPEFVRLQEAYQAMPDGPMKRQLGEKLKTMSTHGPGVNVTYGAPMAGVDTSGNPVFFQPSKGGGAPAIVPGVTPPPKSDQASEDERKAVGWLNQATAAWDNMKAVAFDREGRVLQDARPGVAEYLPLSENVLNATRSEGRQKFVQAASSLSEALLRAATGAGVNKDEAAQKIAELTPRPFDTEAVIQQKMESIPMYLKSLQQRAGRAAPKQDQAPKAPAQTFDAMPPAHQYKGRRLKGDDGTMYLSDGMRWVKQGS